MGIYKKIFQKLTGKEKPKKSRKMKRPRTEAEKKERAQSMKAAKKKKPVFKKLSPEQKAKALELFKKASGEIIKYSGGKPKVTVKPADKKQAASNFWTDTIDLGFIKPTGTQLVVGGTAAALLGAAVYKGTRK